MKSHELATELLRHPNMEVVLQKDSEGSEYGPLADCSSDIIYVPNDTRSGNVYDTDETAENYCLDPEEWDTMKRDQPRAMLLWPINL